MPNHLVDKFGSKGYPELIFVYNFGIHLLCGCHNF